MTRLSVYDPFADVFPELFRGFLQPNVERGRDAPVDIRVDVKESADAYVVHAEIPGVSKEDIHVQVEGNRVSIQAEVKRESEQKEGEKVLRTERYYGSMSRSFQLGSEVDESQASAKYDAGVLTLTLPKKVVVAARKLTIA